MSTSFPGDMLRVLGMLVVGLTAIAVPRTARALAPTPELMQKLAVHASHFEAMRTHASYAIDGRMERVDGDGKADSVKEMHARVDADGKKAQLTVVRYLEDGEDKTADARKKAVERDAVSKEEKREREIRMPFEANEQPRYVFEQLEADRVDPARVKVGFVPKVAARNAIEGTAWVDTRTGTVLSAGFKIAKTGLFVDYVHVTVEFGASTPLGPAISKVTFEGKGGVLFFSKHFRGQATLSGYCVVP